MKLFLDTANIEEIEEALSWGVISGVTTNPTLVSKEKIPFKELVKKICAIMEGYPVSVEAVSTNSSEMVREARELAQVAPNVVVKIPMDKEGLKAVYELSKSPEKVPCNVTLVFSVNQALLAATAGARYVSPFIGRVDDIGWDGVGLVQEIVQTFEIQGLQSEVIAASIRHPRHVHEVAAVGSHIATLPFSVLDNMVMHPLTDRGIEKFQKDWEKVQQENLG